MAGAFAFTAVTDAACSSSSCAGDYDCPAGQTCWTADGQSFSCMPSGPLQAGASCVSTLGAPACSDELACVADGDPLVGRCLYWCDAELVCPLGTCTTITDSNGVTLSFCAGDYGEGQDGGSEPDCQFDASLDGLVAEGSSSDEGETAK